MGNGRIVTEGKNIPGGMLTGGGVLTEKGRDRWKERPGGEMSEHRSNHIK